MEILSPVTCDEGTTAMYLIRAGWVQVKLGHDNGKRNPFFYGELDSSHAAKMQLLSL
jgi:hypothetical protein